MCPKTGRAISKRFRRNRLTSGWLVWLLPITGLAALVWFLIRVIPKPSRAAYPCQRIAAPLACGFLAWMSGLVGSVVIWRKAAGLLRGSRYAAAAACIVLAVLALWWPLGVTGRRATAGFTPTDQANTPMGVARGINPGRVVWVRDANAVTWDGYSGKWWDENNIHQDVVNEMMSKSIRWLTGTRTDTDAWRAIFTHFNRTHNSGDVGYQVGEKIAIKVNMNQDNGGSWSNDNGMPSPQLLYAVVDQLINVVGVPGSAITIYDASRYIGDPLYNKIRNNLNPNFQSVRFVVNPEEAGRGRQSATADTSAAIHYADRTVSYSGRTYPPVCVTEAKYLINMALFRGHVIAGITSLAKNHFGSVWHDVSSHRGWTPEHMHESCDIDERAMGSANALVDLMGHKHLGGKTLLFMIDALYGNRNQGTGPIRFRSFGNDWCCSVFVSQDAVACESVALDFLRNEPVCDAEVKRNTDNYLHEAALADNPRSGALYDPEGDGSRLESLGVHEHWNNAADKQYSRNLGTGNGIELVCSEPFASADLNRDGVVNFLDFGILTGTESI